LLVVCCVQLLLYVSQRVTDQPVRPYNVPPPAAFQPPLAKCDQHDLDMSINLLPGEEVPIAHALAMTSRIRQGREEMARGQELSSSSSASLTRSSSSATRLVTAVVVSLSVVVSFWDGSLC
jgi:hypothetical protein